MLLDCYVEECKRARIGGREKSQFLLLQLYSLWECESLMLSLQVTEHYFAGMFLIMLSGTRLEKNFREKEWVNGNGRIDRLPVLPPQVQVIY